MSARGRIEVIRLGVGRSRRCRGSSGHHTCAWYQAFETDQEDRQPQSQYQYQAAHARTYTASMCQWDSLKSSVGLACVVKRSGSDQRRAPQRHCAKPDLPTCGDPRLIRSTLPHKSVLPASRCFAGTSLRIELYGRPLGCQRWRSPDTQRRMMGALQADVDQRDRVVGNGEQLARRSARDGPEEHPQTPALRPGGGGGLSGQRPKRRGGPAAGGQSALVDQTSRRCARRPGASRNACAPGCGRGMRPCRPAGPAR
jgi:hypothetical protein